MQRLAKGLRSRDNSTVAKEVLEELERLKWFLWYGKGLSRPADSGGLEVDLGHRRRRG